MHCPYCSNAETKVLESRLLDDSMRRRRECIKCENRFTTYERAVFSLTVIKKDGRMQSFDLNKVIKSIQQACGKAAAEQVIELARNVQQKVLRKKINPVKTTDIGRLVLQELKKFDKIAYLRFASVYKSIDDPDLLKKEIEGVL